MGNRKKSEHKPAKKVEQVASSPENTKEALIQAGTRLFATVGYDGTTVKDISERAGVNISLVSYHFQGKEGLYRAVIEQFGSSRLSVSERILIPPSSVEEFKVRLNMFVAEVFHDMTDNPDFCSIVQREIDSGLPVAKDIFANTFLKIFERLHQFLVSAKKEKIIRADVDPLIAASNLHGSIIHMCKMDHLGKEMYGVSLQDESHRNKVVEQVVTIHVNGLLREISRDKA